MIKKNNRIGAILTKAILNVERSEIPIHRGWMLDNDTIFLYKNRSNFLKTKGERV